MAIIVSFHEKMGVKIFEVWKKTIVYPTFFWHSSLTIVYSRNDQQSADHLLDKLVQNGIIMEPWQGGLSGRQQKDLRFVTNCLAVLQCNTLSRLGSP